MDMGYTMIPNRIILTNALSNQAKMIVYILFSYKPCFPSYTHLQKITGFSRSTVAAALKELVGKKIISYQKGNSVTHRANTYQIRPEKDWSIPEDLVRPANYLVRVANQPSSPSELDLVRPANSNKTNLNNNNITTIFSNLNEGEGHPYTPENAAKVREMIATVLKF